MLRRFVFLRSLNFSPVAFRTLDICEICSFLYSPQMKKCANRGQRTKNANSVSRQTNQYKASLHSFRGNSHFYQIHGMNAKGYNTPYGDAFHYLLSLAGL